MLRTLIASCGLYALTALTAHADSAAYGVYADMADGKPFYVGKGNEARFRNITPRNAVHADRLNELGGGHKRIWLAEPLLDETTALRREAELIERHRDTLTNQRRGDVKHRELSFTDKLKHRYKVHVHPTLRNVGRFTPKVAKVGSKVVPVAGVVTFVGFEAYEYNNWRSEHQNAELVSYLDHRVEEVQRDAAAAWDFTYDAAIWTGDAVYDAGVWTSHIAFDFSVAAKDRAASAAGWTAETFGAFTSWTADAAFEMADSTGSLVADLRDNWGN